MWLLRLEKPEKWQKISKNLKKTAKIWKNCISICDIKSWKLIHGQNAFRSNLLSNPKEDFLIKHNKRRKNAKIRGVETLQNIPFDLETIQLPTVKL